MPGIPVHVMDAEEFRSWRRWPQGAIETVLCWLDDPPGRFHWVCPMCGGLVIGQLGEEPVGGWDEPRWVNTGTREKPTLTPSLGCPGWRNGFCSGHYWLRDGELIQA